MSLALIGSLGGCLDMVVPEDGEITLTLDPPVLERGSFATVTVLALDELGAPVMNGTQIFITTDLGMVLPHDEYDAETLTGENRKVNVSTRGGVALATFYAGEARGTATITVKSGAHTITGQFTVGRTPDQILLSVQGQSGESGSLLPPEGGEAVVTAYVVDADDNPVVDVDVVFSTTEGVLESGGGRLRTDSDGTVQDTLSTTVTAQVTASLPGSVSSASLASPPVTITVPGPVILTIVPNTGSYEGGDRIVVTGSDFAFGARVLFDGNEGVPADAEVTPEEWDRNRIEVFTPPSPFGEEDIVDVTVQNPNDTSDTRESGFTYVAPEGT